MSSSQPFLVLRLVLFLALVFAVSPAHANLEKFNTAKLKALDKITARTQSLTVRVGETIQYGPLFITLRTCQKAPPIETPRTVAFLEIAEKTPDRGDKWIFSGWMFASSPALSSMDHPVYDVWVIDCEKGEPYVPEVAEGQDGDLDQKNVDGEAVAIEDGLVPDEAVEDGVADQDIQSAEGEERPIQLEEAIQEQEYTNEAIQQALEGARRRQEEQQALEQQDLEGDATPLEDQGAQEEPDNVEQAPANPGRDISDIMDPWMDSNSPPNVGSDEAIQEQAPDTGSEPNFEDYEFDVDQLFDEPL